jgi:hypothetical protein
VTAPRPKLSICIPTYNRARYLETAFAAILEEADVGCSFEILVSDNHSTDDTPEVIAAWSRRYPQIRSVRQPKLIGYIDNYLSVHRLAIGEYAVYLADDDRLVFPVLANILRFMDDNPNVACAHAPWEQWIVLDVGPVTQFYQVDGPCVFGRHNPIDLFNLIVVKHIFPETCVYRTEPMQKIFFTPFKAYFVFVHLANILGHGDVAFTPEPFYRSVSNQPGLPPRTSVGGMEVLNNRDGYEAGLEYLALRCFQYLGFTSIPDDQLPVLRSMIQSFMDTRLIAATEMLVSSKSWFRATAEFLIRRRAAGLLTDEAANGLGYLPGLAAQEAFMETFGGMSSLRSIGVAGFDDDAAVRGQLLGFRPDAPIHVIGGPEAPGVDPAWTLVLAGPHADRQALIDAGHLPGLILHEAEIARLFRF